MINEAEIVLPRRVVPQPVPFISDGGDCGACALAGMAGLNHPQRIYDLFPKEAGITQEGDAPKGFSWREIRSILHSLKARGYFSDLMVDVPLWMPWGADLHYGPAGYMVSPQWFRYLKMALQAGYYAIANVVFDKTAPEALPDHVVLLTGARLRDGWSEILVSCSSTRTPDEEWIEVSKFLRTRGGYDIYLARPA